MSGVAGEQGSRPPEGAGSAGSGREMFLVLGTLVLGAALLLLASSQDWLGLPERSSSGSGSEVAPAARALGVVGLAGVVAVPATRGIVRRAAGVMLALAGLGAGLATVLAEPGADARAIAPSDTVGFGPWWALSLCGSVCLTLAGVLVVVRCGRWPAMGSRYEAPGGVRRGDAWDMLDHGEDPTAQPEWSERAE